MNLIATLNAECTALAIVGNVLISGDNDGYIKVWNTESHDLLQSFQGHEGRINSIEANTEIIATAGTDRVIRIWDAVTMFLRYELLGHTSPVNSLSLYGKILYSGSDDKTIRLWTWNDGQFRARLGHNGTKTHCVSTSKKYIVSAGDDSYVRVWSNVPERTGRYITKLKHDMEVLAVDVQQDRIVTGCADNKVRIWDAVSGDLLHTLIGHNDEVLFVKIGRYIFEEWGGFFAMTGGADGSLHIWDIDHGKSVISMLDESGGSVNALALSKTDVLMACGTSNRTIELYTNGGGDEGTEEDVTLIPGYGIVNPNFPLPLAPLDRDLRHVQVDFRGVTVFDIMEASHVNLSEFLENNPDDIAYGLYHNGELKSMMTYPREKLYQESIIDKRFYYECSRENLNQAVKFDMVVHEEPFIQVARDGGYFAANQLRAFFDDPDRPRIFAIDMNNPIRPLKYTTFVDNIRVPDGYLNNKGFKIDTESGDHCQAGSNKMLYDLVIIDNASSNKRHRVGEQS
jgi:WD40 repeat protein